MAPGKRGGALPDGYTFPMPKRLVAIGDLQGNLEGLNAILLAAGLVKRSGRWSGGRAHLVQFGDIFGRGADSKGCCDRLRSLAAEARRAGGRVHVLLGNHEAEVVHRYEFECDPREYLAFATPGSLRRWQHRRQEATRSFWSLDEESSLPLENLVKAWELINPLGREEFRRALAPSGEYGKWLSALPTCVKIGELVVSHAGLLPRWAREGIVRVNARVRRDMAVENYFPALPPTNVLVDADGPLWTRRLAWGKRGVRKELHEALRHLDASVQVIAHTPTPKSRIVSRYGRRIIEIDTGIGRPRTGRLSALVVERGVFWALYPPGKPVKIGTVPKPL